MAPLQKRALYSFAISLALTVTLIIVLVARGDVTALHREADLRMVLYAVLVGVPVISLVLVNLTLRKPEQVDERDRRIMERSSKTQWVAVTISLAAWTIVLTEVYWARQQVPVVFLNLIFVSTIIISVLAQSLGILLGYGRPNRDG